MHRFVKQMIMKAYSGFWQFANKTRQINEIAMPNVAKIKFRRFFSQLKIKFITE